MADSHNVFISWSGERSKAGADALREWLGTVLQNARPWMSETDIEKGSRGLDEIARALEGMKVGIICLTPENLSAEWILFEAGALSKTLDAKTRVCTYLLAGLEAPPAPRSTQDMVEEILELNRMMAPVVMEFEDELEKARKRVFFGDALRGVGGVDLNSNLVALSNLFDAGKIPAIGTVLPEPPAVKSHVSPSSRTHNPEQKK